MDFFHKNTINDVKIFIDTNPHACGMKDKDSVFLFTNASYARLVGFKDAEDFIGRTDFDLPCEASQCAPLFRAQDQDVILKPRIMKILDVHPEAEGKWHALFTTKTVFFNTDGEIGGTFFQLHDISSQALLQFSFILGKSAPYQSENKFLNQFSYMLGAPHTLALNPRQEQILFFLMRRHSVKKIALALGISLRTLYSELEHLKTKFNASTINELVDKSITQGCINIIPNGLSYCQISAVLQED